MEYRHFIQEYPGYKHLTLDSFIDFHFPESTSKVYADWTGAALPPEFLITDHAKFRIDNRLGNPHSTNSSSMLSSKYVEETRQRVLKYFNADPEEYDVIFTSNASGAIGLLRHFFYDGGILFLAADNHNAVNGLREGDGPSRVAIAPFGAGLRLNETTVEKYLVSKNAVGNSLFAFPAKSNYSGEIYPLEWVKLAIDNGYYVLLDAAAYVANYSLDLSVVHPHFVPISFYKMFGYPTGIGALIIRKDAYPVLQKKWFMGGTVDLVSFNDNFYVLKEGHEAYEDGTINFGEIHALIDGLNFRKGLGDVSQRTLALGAYLYDQLSQLVNGEYSVTVHSSRKSDTVTFNIVGPDGFVLQKSFVDFANEHGVDVRAGCFCNPGASEVVNGDKVTQIHTELFVGTIRPKQEEIEAAVEQKRVGAIRISFGYASRFSDAKRVFEVVKLFIASLREK